MPQLKDGSDFQIDHHIVGDESGLRNLIYACEKAIEQGEYIGNVRFSFRLFVVHFCFWTQNSRLSLILRLVYPAIFRRLLRRYIHSKV
ncbi:hypothetical protein JF50_07650 [Pseudoalteromonas luteoviolacea]|uniref:Uncharacterized protein n=1 Tax=Pseudoalteromonas luteoviolacea TaxID=43657 RepID=A0A0C1MR52_9GAMM|nr:hypothetical protein [Pseudoalteromonas luteoviolacea]KID57066.1 hypothetical protein JF50_14520 [Pseudoalteromonas luteoviolacea]KID57113.1 hypothetical protein JF50_07650 [Pseudoalteromonas luteoviolacea]